LLQQFANKTFEDTIYIDDLTICIRPITYKEFTQNALKTFEEQRVFAIVNNEDMPEIEKIGKFNESFKKLTELTVGMIISSIVSIEVGEEKVTNPYQIKEFIENADKRFYKTVTDHIEAQKKNFNLKPLHVMVNQEDVDKGAPVSYEIPITFDQSNFFG